MQTKPSWQGLAAGIGAFTIWGLLPLYWKALKHVPPLEILSHRIVWSLLFSGLLLVILKQWGNVRAALRTRRNILLLCASSMLIGVNWLLYIWAVNSGHIVECSLGYYINPLVNVVLGFLFFRDKLRPLQWLAVGLAVCGVMTQLIEYGRLPWIALTLAITFGFYGLTRKVMETGPLAGLVVETSILALPAALFLGSLAWQGDGVLGSPSLADNALALGAGIVTSTPLLLFAAAARRLKLATLGVLQYIGPSGMFLLGVMLYGEPFPLPTQITFGFIWAGVIVYAGESYHHLRQAERLRTV